MRVNEPFGDAVNWDLIPRGAISSIQLIPGSNPAFGLNTLGGAVAIYTKSGASEYPDQPAGAMTFSGGSFGQQLAELETGGRRGPWEGLVRRRASPCRPRLGPPQPQPRRPGLRQARLAGRRHRHRRDAEHCRHASRRRPDDTAQSRRAARALHVPRLESEPGRVGVAQGQPCTDEDAARERDGLPARRSWPQLQQQRQRFRCRRKSRCQRRVDHRAEEPASKTIRFFARIDNLLDRRYASFGILGTNVFTGEGRSFDPDNPRHEQFRGYGAPRSLSVGMQIAFGGA